MTGEWRSSRVTHAALETHGAVGWLDDEGRLVIRSSTQVPFLARNELAHVFGLERDRVRVYATRVGGGFGGKQELFTEDLTALAVLKLGRPVAYEFSRTDQFVRASLRHPMRVRATLGADADGTLTAMKLDVLSDTGAYGNHAIGVLFHSCAESTTLYRVPTKWIDAEAVYTNNPPSGAFRGYGLGQVVFAVESAMDALAQELGLDPFDLRRINAVREGDPLHPDDDEKYEEDLIWGSYGLDQCLDLAQEALRRGNGVEAPEGWLVGEGMAAAMIATMAPRGHIAHTTATLRADGTYLLRVGTAEFGNGTSTVHRQIAATVLDAPLERLELWAADTDAVRHDTGAFASAGTVVAGKALFGACTALRRRMVAIATELASGESVLVGAGLRRDSRRRAAGRGLAGTRGGGRRGRGLAGTRGGRRGQTEEGFRGDVPPTGALAGASGGTGASPKHGAEEDAAHVEFTASGIRVGDAVVTWERIVAAGAGEDDEGLTADGAEFGDLRSLAFNVHAARVAVDPETGTVKVLQSVQSADAGVVINPAQCRGQIEGGAAQALGGALYEEVLLEDGVVQNPVFRTYRVPQFADVPDTEVYFAETDDSLGPFGAKSMSESPYNPVGAAIGNAVSRAVGRRGYELPFSRGPGVEARERKLTALARRVGARRVGRGLCGRVALWRGGGAWRGSRPRPENGGACPTYGECARAQLTISGTWGGGRGGAAGEAGDMGGGGGRTLVPLMAGACPTHGRCGQAQPTRSGTCPARRAGHRRWAERRRQARRRRQAGRAHPRPTYGWCMSHIWPVHADRP